MSKFVKNDHGSKHGAAISRIEVDLVSSTFFTPSCHRTNSRASSTAGAIASLARRCRADTAGSSAIRGVRLLAGDADRQVLDAEARGR